MKDTISNLTEAQHKLKQLQKQRDNLASDIITTQKKPSTEQEAAALLGLAPAIENQQPQLENMQHEVKVLANAIVMQKRVIAEHQAQAVREARDVMLPQHIALAKQAHQHLTAFVETVQQDAAICSQAASQGVELGDTMIPLTLGHMVKFNPTEMLKLWQDKHKALLAG